MELKNITFSYPETKVFSSLNLTLPDKKITAVLGPSGCGKTTLLRILSNEVKFFGTIEGQTDEISYIFQDPLLLSHLTVENNVDFFLKKAFLDKKTRKKIVDEILAKVELTDSIKKYPSSLSGGMAQRVSLARAFAYPAKLLLMDEPFKGLDYSLKKRILDIFLRMYENDKKTTVFVTHDIDEALLLADKIVVITDGNIVYEKELPERTERKITDFPEIKNKLYEIL